MSYVEIDSEALHIGVELATDVTFLALQESDWAESDAWAALADYRREEDAIADREIAGRILNCVRVLGRAAMPAKSSCDEGWRVAS